MSDIDTAHAPPGGADSSSPSKERAGASDASLLQEKIASTPDEFARFLLKMEPISWWAPGKFWLVTRYDLGRQVMRGQEFTADRSPFFVSRMANLDLALIKDFFQIVKQMMVMTDDEEHENQRRLASTGLVEHRIDELAATVQRVIDGLLSKALEKGYIEFVADVAQPLPSTILCEMFDISPGERDDFYRWSNNMTQFFGGASQYRNEDGVEVNESASSIRAHFRRLVEKRKGGGGRDFISTLVRHQKDLGIGDDELIAQAIMMLVAGNITTTDQLCNNVFTALSHAGCWEALRADPTLIPTAMEELNRWDPGVTFVFRQVRAPVRVGGEQLSPGDVVFISTHAVNRDADVFDDPFTLKLDRKLNPHFAYGHGAHFCLGAPLARLQMKLLFATLAARLPDLRLDPTRPSVRKHSSLAFSGFNQLFLRY